MEKKQKQKKIIRQDQQDKQSYLDTSKNNKNFSEKTLFFIWPKKYSIFLIFFFVLGVLSLFLANSIVFAHAHCDQHRLWNTSIKQWKLIWTNKGATHFPSMLFYSVGHHWFVHYDYAPHIAIPCNHQALKRLIGQLEHLDEQQVVVQQDYGAREGQSLWDTLNASMNITVQLYSKADPSPKNTASIVFSLAAGQGSQIYLKYKHTIYLVDNIFQSLMPNAQMSLLDLNIWHPPIALEQVLAFHFHLFHPLSGLSTMNITHQIIGQKDQWVQQSQEKARDFKAMDSDEILQILQALAQAQGVNVLPIVSSLNPIGIMGWQYLDKKQWLWLAPWGKGQYILYKDKQQYGYVFYGWMLAHIFHPYGRLAKK